MMSMLYCTLPFPTSMLYSLTDILLFLPASEPDGAYEGLAIANWAPTSEIVVDLERKPEWLSLFQDAITQLPCHDYLQALGCLQLLTPVTSITPSCRPARALVQC